MKHVDDTERSLTREDRRLIEAIGENLRHEPMDPIRAARFRRRVEERIEARRPLWRGGLVWAATAFAAVALWLALPDAPAPVPTELVVETADHDEDTPILLAVAASEGFGTSIEPENYLPADYLALESLLDLEGSDV